MGHLDERVAIVTGAGRGIGRAVAAALATEGATVIVADSGAAADGSGEDPGVAEAAAEEIRSRGGLAVAAAGSLVPPGAAEALVERTVKERGRLDAVVHAAGLRADEPLSRLSDANWEATLTVHLGLAARLLRSGAPPMARAGGGSFVLTTSVAGLLGNVGKIAESAAAGGVIGLMRAAAIELQRQRVRVNAVAPLARTRLTEDVPLFAEVATLTPEHVAPAYVFLASPLSEGVTGFVVTAAGGRLAALRVAETGGRYKDTDGGIWSAAEIRDAWRDIARG